jgi:superfamily II RNA helicase
MLTIPDPDEILDGFVDHVVELGLELYEAQEEAILELIAGANVVLNTPTGSGKSLVATAAHYAALAHGRRSVYTAPIKALVSEKFFALCRDFGSERVGMITGDVSVNAGAPIICCTAEILANWALREGAGADVDLVVADEFHYYGDPQRGWAWQVPLLELPHVQFLLMSATLGPTAWLVEELERRTGRASVLVRSTDRPVPLDFAYRTTRLVHSIEKLLELGRAPVYIVHFTQREAAEQAQSLLSIDVLTKDEKAQVNEIIGGFRFDSPIGKDMRRFVTHGIGLHHAGLLPKYRLLVEKLAQAGLLKLICGTDTLGVGVNVPIRTVLFSQLCKFDGSDTRVLRVREFQQIAGRAGRRGFDTMGTVWAQAPAHWIENRIGEEKAAVDAKKKKKLVKKKAPERGYSHWDEATFVKLIEGEPEPLTSSFQVTHQMLLNLLDRPGDGCAAVRTLMVDNHETRRRQRAHIRRAIGIYRSLVAAEVVEHLDEPDEHGRSVRVTIDLSDTFALNQPLSLFALEAVEALDLEHETHALDVVSVIESVLESPRVILAAQLDKLIGDTLAELKRRGVEYDERMDEIAELSHPKPLEDFLYGSFNLFRAHHPWVEGDTVKPKAIVRDLYERAMTFRDYVNHYGLKRSEGVLLRYLTDAYRALRQTVPDAHRTDQVDDIVEWLGELVRQVDSSLIDEWEKLQHPDEVQSEEIVLPERRDVTQNTRAVRVMVRNEMFRWITLLARRDSTTLAEAGRTLTAEEIDAAIAGYWDVHDRIVLDGDARGPDHFELDESGTVRQTISDPEGWNEWYLAATVDWVASAEAGEPVLDLLEVTRRG